MTGIDPVHLFQVRGAGIKYHHYHTEDGSFYQSLILAGQLK